jgi:dTDP-4-keto-6-deoxyhexose 4-ketoreductase
VASQDKLITVLGASGLVGTAVARLLADRPVRLRLVGRRPIAVPDQCTARVEVRQADLTAPGEVAAAVDGAAAVIHLVAHMAGPGTWRVTTGDPVAERVNVGLVHDVIEAIRGQRPAAPPVVVFAGSVSEGIRPAAEILDGPAGEPLTAYDRQKLAAEQAIDRATANGLLRGSTLRLATLYTRGTDPTALDHGVVVTMTRRAFAGEPLTMWHDGSVKRDLLCADDAAAAFVAALDAADRAAGRSWPVGTGQQTSIADLFSTIAKVVASHTGRPPAPVVSVPPAAYSMATDLVDFGLDPTAFRDATGWTPRVALLEGLESLAAAYASETAGAR